MTKKSKRPKTNYLDPLTPREKGYVKDYTNPDAPTFLNATASVQKNYNAKDAHSASVMAVDINKRPRVQEALRQALDNKDLDQLILDGIHERLQDPMSRHWQPTADYVSKIRGDFAPDKQIQVNLSPEDRDAKYEKIMQLVKGDTTNNDESEV